MTTDATILIVDDDPTNLKVLHDTLKETGYRLLMARGGQRALYQVEHQPPDLILLDVLMPDIDGFETCRRLKCNPKTEHIPVIFLTALNDVSHKVEGFTAGGVDYITKPFQQQEVLLRVENHLTTYRLKQRLQQQNQAWQIQNEQLQRSLADVERLSGLLRTVIDLVPMAVYAKDINGRKIIGNATDVQYSGVSSEADLLGKTDAEIYPAETAAAFMKDDEKILRQGASIINQESNRITIDNRHRWFLSRKVPLRDSAGEIVGLVGTTLDITERKEMEQLQAAQLAISQILAGASDPENGLVQVLAGVGEKLDWHLAELWCVNDRTDQLNWRGGWHAPGRAGLGELAQSRRAVTFARGEGIPGQVWQSGEILCMPRGPATSPASQPSAMTAAGLRSALGMPVLVDGVVVGVMAFFSQTVQRLDERLQTVLADLSRQIGQFMARKQAEAELREERALLAHRVEERTVELRRALRAKDDFMATMTHELRTPLNGILGMVQILQQEVYGPLNEDQRQPVQIIHQSGQRLFTLINEILDLAEIDKLELDLQPVLVADVCQTSLWKVEDLAAQKKIQLSLQLDDYDLWLQADPRRLQQILGNLLDNAIKFTPTGGEVTLSASDDPAQSFVRLAVQDTGIGIAADDISRLFKPFTQLDAGLTRQYEGAGLGLAMVQQLVRLHGGTIAVTSAGVAGQGSCFTVCLPRQA